MVRHLSGTCGFFIIIAVSLSIALFSCFGDRGLKEVFALQEELQRVVSINRDLQQENESLEHYVYLLKNDTALIEKIAREELGLAGADELVYFFKNR